MFKTNAILATMMLATCALGICNQGESPQETQEVTSLQHGDAPQETQPVDIIKGDGVIRGYISIVNTPISTFRFGERNDRYYREAEEALGEIIEEGTPRVEVRVVSNESDEDDWVRRGITHRPPTGLNCAFPAFLPLKIIASDDLKEGDILTLDVCNGQKVELIARQRKESRFGNFEKAWRALLSDSIWQKRAEICNLEGESQIMKADLDQLDQNIKSKKADLVALNALSSSLKTE